jgi:hypothetical protein
MASKKPVSKLVTTPLPKVMRTANTGAIDNTTLPKPKPEEWGGWVSAPQGEKDA